MQQSLPTPRILNAEKQMGFTADVRLDIRHRQHVDNDGDRKPGTLEQGNHRHVAIEWEGGVLWLDMSDLFDHYCIDVRQFRDGDEIAQGVFAIENGGRISIEETKVKAHGHNAVFMPILLTDKENPVEWKPEDYPRTWKAQEIFDRRDKGEQI